MNGVTGRRPWWVVSSIHDRRALLDGLAEFLAERIGMTSVEAELEHVDQILERVPTAFERFDTMPEAAKAELLLSPDPGARSASARRRTERFAEIVGNSFPDLDPAEQHRLLAVMRTLLSSYTWLRMREDFGLTGRQSGTLVSWVLGMVFDDVRRTGTVGPAATGSEDDGPVG